jgi:hypothetical protein
MSKPQRKKTIPDLNQENIRITQRALFDTIGVVEVYKPLDILRLNRMINHRVFE